MIRRTQTRVQQALAAMEPAKSVTASWLEGQGHQQRCRRQYTKNREPTFR